MPLVNPKTLVLLDIDGTLLDAAGQGREAFHQALDAFFPGFEFPRFSMAGRTDFGLWKQFTALTPAPIPRFEDFLPRYTAHLDQRLRTTPPVALPGVRELLAALEEAPDLHPGLVTGNVFEGSRLKLFHCDLWEPFERTGVHPGAYGESDHDKGPLARKALAHWGEPTPAILVGDTPEDIRCAHLAGIPCLAVATGGFDAETLHHHGADEVLPDVSDTAFVLARIRALARVPRRENHS